MRANTGATARSERRMCPTRLATLDRLGSSPPSSADPSGASRPPVPGPQCDVVFKPSGARAHQERRWDATEPPSRTAPAPTLGGRHRLARADIPAVQSRAPVVPPVDGYTGWLTRVVPRSHGRSSTAVQPGHRPVSRSRPGRDSARRARPPPRTCGATHCDATTSPGSDRLLSAGYAHGPRTAVAVAARPGSRTRPRHYGGDDNESTDDE